MVIEPPPAELVKDAMVWLKLFKSQIPPLEAVYPIVTSVVLGSAFAVPFLIIPEFEALKNVAPV